MMPWEDEERIDAALEAKGRTVCANIVRRIGLPSPDRNPKGGDAQQGSVEDEGRFPAPMTPLPPLWIWIRK